MLIRVRAHHNRLRHQYRAARLVWRMVYTGPPGREGESAIHGRCCGVGARSLSTIVRV